MGTNQAGRVQRRGRTPPTVCFAMYMAPRNLLLALCCTLSLFSVAAGDPDCGQVKAQVRTSTCKDGENCRSWEEGGETRTVPAGSKLSEDYCTCRIRDLRSNALKVLMSAETGMGYMEALAGIKKEHPVSFTVSAWFSGVKLS